MVIGILDIVVQISLEVVRVDPRAHLDSRGCVTNRIAILDNIFALGNRLNGKLVATVNILLQGYLLAVYLDHLARLQVVGQSYCNIIYGVNL